MVKLSQIAKIDSKKPFAVDSLRIRSVSAKMSDEIKKTVEIVIDAD